MGKKIRTYMDFLVFILLLFKTLYSEIDIYKSVQMVNVNSFQIKKPNITSSSKAPLCDLPVTNTERATIPRLLIAQISFTYFCFI